MKILILANNATGLYKFRKELLQELSKEKNEVYVSCPYDKEIEYLKNLNIQFEDIKIARRGTNPIEDIKLIIEYKKLLKKIKPDVVLTYTIKPNIYGGIACRSKGIKYIANITGLGTAVENKGIIQKITLNLYKIAFKKVSCVFFQNEENKTFFERRKICNKSYRLIPGSGVNVEEFKLLEYPKEEKIKFVFISRIMKEKGIDQYLEMAKYIKEKYKNTEFHICGFCEENYKGMLDELEKKGIIIYHGMVKDIREVLKEIHCTIHPTYYPEGMSNVLLESAASGRPIISTNRSGCREIIDNEATGYIVSMKNTEELIKKVEKFIELKYIEKKEMGLRGREKVKKEFNRNIVIDKYLEELNS